MAKGPILDHLDQIDKELSVGCITTHFLNGSLYSGTPTEVFMLYFENKILSAHYIVIAVV